MRLSSVALCVPLFDETILTDKMGIRPIYIFHILYSIFDICARIVPKIIPKIQYHNSPVDKTFPQSRQAVDSQEATWSW